MRHRIIFLCAALLSACAANGPLLPSDEGLFHDSHFVPPAQPIRVDEVLAISPQMRAYLKTTAEPELRERGPQWGLVEALHSKGQLRLEYDAERTRNASEAFDARAGNCLSLVLMTAAFAKELGLRVRYQAVDVGGIWERNGNLVLHVGHVNLALGRPMSLAPASRNPQGWLTVDFIRLPEGEKAHVWAIGEERVLAMYMNNRAAEELAAGHVDNAYAWVRSAIAQDRHFVTAYNTLGVVYQQRGLLQPAEAALRRALLLEPDNVDAMGNLVGVLGQSGRHVEARELAAQLRRIEPTPPFAHFSLGMQALRDGDYRKARDLFEKDVARSNGFHELHFGLAQAHFHLGDVEAAARHLRLAQQNSLTRRQQALYSAKLDRLRASSAH